MQNADSSYALFFFHRPGIHGNKMSKSDISDDGLSDFEQIDGSSAGESFHGWETTQVAFALPASLRSASECTNTTTHMRAGHESVGSTLFANKLKNLESETHPDNKDSDDTDEDDGISSTASWSHVGSASSTTSSFDILSLTNGDVQRSCHRCTFINSYNAGICGGCGLAIVSNPCLDVDAQIAKNLQQREEDNALKQLQAEEKKRELMAKETLLVRSEILVNDVVSFVMRCKETEVEGAGVDTIPKDSLIIVASRFIESADRANMEGRAVQILYHFSTTIHQIRLDELGPYAPLSNNIEAAYDSRELYHIGEESELEEEPRGWIVAAVTSVSYEKTVKVSSGCATVWGRVESAECLPLVSFDASLRNKDIIRRLVNGLSTICFDFFQTCWRFADQHEIERQIFDAQLKKLKPSEPEQAFGL